MKKLLVVLLALTALSVAAFADDVTWTYGATIKTGATITPTSDNATPIGLAIYDADDSVASRVRFDAEAALGDFSAHIRVGGDLAGNTTSGAVTTVSDLTLTQIGALPGASTLTSSGTAAGGTFLNAWWVTAKVLDKMLEIRAGNIDNSVTDTVNNGWGGSSVEGAQFVIVPVSGFSIAYGLPFVTEKGYLMEALAASKVGFAYSMPNLATVKFTYVNGGGKNNSNVYGGVRILAVPNLTADLEFQAPYLGNKDAVTATLAPAGFIEIFANAQYAMGPLAPGAVIDATLFNNSSFKTQFYVKPYVDYTVNDGLMVGGNVKFTANAGGASGVNALVVDPYLKFIFNSKAALKSDFAFTVPDLKSTSDWTFPMNFNFMWSF